MMNKKMLLIISLVSCFGLQVEASYFSEAVANTSHGNVCTPIDELLVSAVSFLDSTMLTLGVAAFTIVVMKACDIGDVLVSLVEDPDVESWSPRSKRKER